jgi:tripartite-type tricarboxylate transporter receptor subunit TctC
MRRIKTSQLLLAIALLMPLVAWAQAYPARPVRLIISFPPGGALDVVGRPVAQKLSEALKQPVVVENRGGAGGTIGSEYVAKQPPDGQVILLTAGTSHGTGSSFYANLPYDPLKDFVAIAAAVEVVVTLAAHPQAPFQDIKTLTDYARANPGKISYGTSRASCCARRRASTSCMCPTRGPGRRSPISSADRSRSRSFRSHP